MAAFHWLPLQLCSAVWLTWLSYVDNGSLFQAGELIPSWLPLALGFCSSLKLDRFCYAQLHVLHGSLTWIMALCFKLPSNVPSKPRANDSVAPVPNVTKGRDSVFNQLGPQGGTFVAGCSEANQPANCRPNLVPVVDEIVSENGTVMPNSGG
ncbi:hypothetical protein POTOM_048873 [Populus tomentosa]|uniref:Uncharacterized protein n=1 Tax=Populus tomentosa TaxID=118781 RepID=A0A8X7YG04_POPTO|nr:hypothetical protein POTOM_048873 [Populus tomentosa]